MLSMTRAEGLFGTDVPAAPEVNDRLGGASEERFQATLRAVILMLQHDQRVTYRTLKYAFGIDGVLLDEICEELHLRRLAIDEEGKVLVWISVTPDALEEFAGRGASWLTRARTQCF